MESIIEAKTKERSVLTSVSEMTQLQVLADPIVEWIRAHYGLNTEVSVTWDRVQIKHDGMGIPFPIVEK